MTDGLNREPHDKSFLLWEAIDKGVRAISQADGSFTQEDVVEVVRELMTRRDDLAPDLLDQLQRQQAVGLAARYTERRKPKRSKKKGVLYTPGAVIRLGEGKRVFMADLRIAGIGAWSVNELENAARQQLGTAKTLDYLASRRQAMERHPDKTLDWIERNIFDYTDGDENGGLDGDGDEE